jgi:hypothetical protein
MFYNMLGRFAREASMAQPVSPKNPRARRATRKPRRHVWFEATVQNDHVHVQASAPTKWFRILRWIILIIVIALIIRFLPECGKPFRSRSGSAEVTGSADACRTVVLYFH